MGTVDLNDAVRLLQATRTELVPQLEAIDKALAALGGAGGRPDDRISEQCRDGSRP